MANLEIIFLTVIVVVLFAIFIFGPLLYAQHTTKGIPDGDKNKYVTNVVNTLTGLRENKKISIEEKEKVIMGIQRTIADMETNGMYFPSEVIEELRKQKEELCNYSGLPSVDSYKKD